MNNTERTLLLGALRSVKTVALQGCTSDEAQILSVVKSTRGAYETWDLRAGSVPAEISVLREDLARKLGGCPTLVVLLAAKVPEMAREVLGELTLGALKVNPDAPQKLADEVRVIALSKEKVMAEDAAELFGLVVSGMVVIEEQRAAAKKAEDDLKAAQARARESSRQHGLT